MLTDDVSGKELGRVRGQRSEAGPTFVIRHVQVLVHGLWDVDLVFF